VLSVVIFILPRGKNQVYFCGAGTASAEQVSVRDPPSSTLFLDAFRAGFLGESEITILNIGLLNYEHNYKKHKMGLQLE